MRGIGGNTTAVIQNPTTTKNGIGEYVQTWMDVQTIRGWLDLSGGEARYNAFSAKIQQSTHVFIADFVPLASGVSAENSRMVVNGQQYDITLIDNPMELGKGSQLEFYLKFTGGQ